MAALEKAISAKPVADKCAVHTFEASPHGFAMARADLKKEADRKVFHEAYERLGKFFVGAGF